MIKLQHTGEIETDVTITLISSDSLLVVNLIGCKSVTNTSFIGNKSAKLPRNSTT
jgi:hypothetical protein